MAEGSRAQITFPMETERFIKTWICLHTTLREGLNNFVNDSIINIHADALRKLHVDSKKCLCDSKNIKWDNCNSQFTLEGPCSKPQCRKLFEFIRKSLVNPSDRSLHWKHCNIPLWANNEWEFIKVFTKSQIAKHKPFTRQQCDCLGFLELLINCTKFASFRNRAERIRKYRTDLDHPTEDFTPEYFVQQLDDMILLLQTIPGAADKSEVQKSIHEIQQMKTVRLELDCGGKEILFEIENIKIPEEGIQFDLQKLKKDFSGNALLPNNKCTLLKCGKRRYQVTVKTSSIQSGTCNSKIDTAVEILKLQEVKTESYETVVVQIPKEENPFKSRFEELADEIDVRQLRKFVIDEFGQDILSEIVSKGTRQLQSEYLIQTLIKKFDKDPEVKNRFMDAAIDAGYEIDFNDNKVSNSVSEATEEELSISFRDGKLEVCTPKTSIAARYSVSCKIYTDQKDFEVNVKRSLDVGESKHSAKLHAVSHGFVVEDVSDGSVILHLRFVSHTSMEDIILHFQSKDFEDFILEVCRAKDVLPTIEDGNLSLVIEVDTFKECINTITANLTCLQETLLENQIYFIKEVEPRVLLTTCSAKGILDEVEVEQIKTPRRRRERAALLLDILLNKTESQVRNFIESLKDAKYDHLATVLEEEANKKEKTHTFEQTIVKKYDVLAVDVRKEVVRSALIAEKVLPENYFSTLEKNSNLSEFEKGMDILHSILSLGDDAIFALYSALDAMYKRKSLTNPAFENAEETEERPIYSYINEKFTKTIVINKYKGKLNQVGSQVGVPRINQKVHADSSDRTKTSLVDNAGAKGHSEQSTCTEEQGVSVSMHGQEVIPSDVADTANLAWSVRVWSFTRGIFGWIVSVPGRMCCPWNHASDDRLTMDSLIERRQVTSSFEEELERNLPQKPTAHRRTKSLAAASGANATRYIKVMPRPNSDPTYVNAARINLVSSVEDPSKITTEDLETTVLDDFSEA